VLSRPRHLVIDEIQLRPADQKGSPAHPGPFDISEALPGLLRVPQTAVDAASGVEVGMEARTDSAASRPKLDLVAARSLGQTMRDDRSGAPVGAASGALSSSSELTKATSAVASSRIATTGSARGVLGSASRRVTAARQADALATMVGVGEGHVPPAAPGRIPATRTPPHASDIHVLSWVYRGSGYLDIDGRRCERGRGTATWIPAGVEHVTGLRENSVSLPLGDVSPADLHLDEPLQAQFPSAWDDYLMFCSVSARSLLRPDGYHPTHILDLFREQLAAQRARSAPMPTDRRAHAAATEFLRTVGTGGGPASQDLPAEVHRAFREETGMTFASWRYAARMRIARDLLAGGSKPSAVARRVGYAHLPNFSSAFSRFHGMSAREYQEREAQRP
jgi:mannose-6-phosphate isomerase-like protein (cupin superfamily)